MTGGRPIILTLCDYYLPGFRAGGTVRTLAGILEQLSDEFFFSVITRDRDLGETQPYDQISPNTWRPLEAGQIMYLAPSGLRVSSFRRLISSTEHDVLYLNSWFSVPFGVVPLLLRRLRLIPRRPLIIAPRGEFAAGARSLHSVRKSLYLHAAKALGFTRDVVWQASGTHEKEDIRRLFGNRVPVVIAPDLPALGIPANGRRVEKQPGLLRVLFLSRISRVKNLEGALNLLQGVKGDVRFSIYGPIEDAEYWKRCQDRMQLLPTNVAVSYGGPVGHDQISQLMSQHDLLFLPTLGENFGHTILEAMVSGCPVLISDRTRWRALEEAGVGWDVSLDDPGRFQEIIRRCLAMDADVWEGLSASARLYAAQRLGDPEALEQNRRLFRHASNQKLMKAPQLGG